MKKFLLDLLPVMLFFVALKLGEQFPDASTAFANHWFAWMAASGQIGAKVAPIMIATIVTIIATLVQVTYMLITRQRIDPLLWLSTACVVILGGLTVYFQSETFIKWKPTALYWVIALAIQISHMISGKSLIRNTMELQVSLPEPIWVRLNVWWISFFVGMGALNLVVAYNFSTDTWASFKAFGSTALTFVFIFAQTIMLSKHVEEPKT